MNIPQLKNRIKRSLYAPGKSRFLTSDNIKTINELENALSESLGYKTEKKEDKDEKDS